MPKRIFIKDGGLTSSVPTPAGYTVIGSDGGIPKKQVQSTISDIARPYRVCTALLTQSGTASPVATVLENTIGNIVWSYETVGQYRATLSDAFTIDKTFFSIVGNTGGDGWIFFIDDSGLPNYFDLVQYDSLGANLDNLKCYLEIRVYN